MFALRGQSPTPRPKEQAQFIQSVPAHPPRLLITPNKSKSQLLPPGGELTSTLLTSTITQQQQQLVIHKTSPIIFSPNVAKKQQPPSTIQQSSVRVQSFSPLVVRRESPPGNSVVHTQQRSNFSLGDAYAGGLRNSNLNFSNRSYAAPYLEKSVQLDLQQQKAKIDQEQTEIYIAQQQQLRIEKEKNEVLETLQKKLEARVAELEQQVSSARKPPYDQNVALNSDKLALNFVVLCAEMERISYAYIDKCNDTQVLRRDMHTLQEALEQQRSECNAAERIQQQLEEETSTLKLHIEALTRENLLLQEEVRSMLAQSRVTARVSDLESKANTLLAENDKLTLSFAEQTQKHAHERQMWELQRKELELQKKRAEEESAFNERERSNVLLQAELTQKKYDQQLFVLQEAKLDLEKKCYQLMREREGLEAQSQSQVQNTEEENRALREQVRHSEQHVAVLQQQSDELQRCLEKNEIVFNEMKLELQESLQQNQRAAHLHSTIKAFQEESVRLREDVHNWTQKCQSADARAQQAAKMLLLAAAENERLHILVKRLGAAEGQVRELQGLTAQLQNQIHKLSEERNVLRLSQQVEHGREELLRESEQKLILLAQDGQQLALRIREREAEIAALQQELARAQHDRVQAQYVLQNLEQQLTHFKQENGRLSRLVFKTLATPSDGW